MNNKKTNVGVGLDQPAKNNRGITLIALIITIIVMLILVSVAVRSAVNSGLFGHAQNAVGKWAEEQKKEGEVGNGSVTIGDKTYNSIDEYLAEQGATPNERVDVATITTRVDKNTPAKDSLGNPITIPEGFKVVPDGTTSVEYNYMGDKKPTVQDGIVVEDEAGNQFVWIPVGSIKNKDNTTTSISLGRYAFDVALVTDGGDEGCWTVGTGAIKQAILDGNELTVNADEGTSGFGCLEETTDSVTYGNTKAKNIEEFKTKAKTDGGYYLGRYEASKGADNIVKSKPGLSFTTREQGEAAVLAGGMYDSSNFECDLVNSYAWDTAIVFIQAFSGDGDYSTRQGPDYYGEPLETGTGSDKRCNIYDMASVYQEWTTESCMEPDEPCVLRGGETSNSRFAPYVACREPAPTRLTSWGAPTFRVLLYL